jgi:hypothetical protein
MTVKEIADLIDLKGYCFEVVIPSSTFSYGKKTPAELLRNNESVEDYINKIAKANKSHDFIVKRFGRNGGKNTRGIQKWRCIEVFNVSWLKTEGMDGINPNHPITTREPPENHPKTTQEPPNNHPRTTQEPPNNHPRTTQEPPENHPTHTKTTTMQDKDYIDFKVLEVKHNQLEGFYNEAKSKINKLEKKVEDLHDENKQLLRVNTTTEDKHAIALERAKLDMEREAKDAKGGLNGVMEFAQENPETIKMVLGALFPNNPNFKQDAGEQKALSGATHEIGNIKYVEDHGANQVLNDIPLKLSQKDGDTIAKIYMLFQKFMSDETILNDTVRTLLPEYPL